MQHAREDLRRLHPAVLGRPAFDQPDEAGGLRAAEQLLLAAGLQCLEQRAAVRLRVFLQEAHPLAPQVSLGDVGDAAEGEIVLVDGHAEIAQGVLDLRPVEELHAAVDGVRDLLAQEDLLQVPGQVMGAVQDGAVPPGDAGNVQLRDACGDGGRLLLRVLPAEADHGSAVRQDGDEVFSDAVFILVDQGIDGVQDLRRGAVVLHHQDRPRFGEGGVEIREIAAVGAAPGVDGLIRIPDDEQVSVIAAQDLHQPVLRFVDVLELVDHDVFQPLLPLLPDLRGLAEDVQGEQEQVVVIQTEALLLLVQVAVEQDVPDADGGIVLFLQPVQRQLDQVQIVVRLPEQLDDLEHVPRLAEGHVPQGQAPLLVDDLQHLVDVRVVQHQKALRVADGVAVLLQDGDAEAVERTDVAGVLVADHVVDAPAHLVGGLVGEGDAQDVAGEDAELLHQIGEAAGQGARLAAAGPGQHADEALRLRDGFPLGLVQSVQNAFHGAPPLRDDIPSIAKKRGIIHRFFEAFVIYLSSSIASTSHMRPLQSSGEMNTFPHFGQQGRSSLKFRSM